MRITSGWLRNRRFEVPKGDVRPTMESVREALFSSLGGSCEGWRVLDLFAGSGALGLEAWSRGAEHVRFVEKQSAAVAQLEASVATLRMEVLGAVEVVRADVLRWLPGAFGCYDLIFADPPYDLPEAFSQTLAGVVRSGILAESGWLVYEMRGVQSVEIPADWKVMRDKAYGKTRVVMLKRESG